MALVKCVDCGREVSNAAPACPGCGRPLVVAAPLPVVPAAAPAPASSSGLSFGSIMGALLFLGGIAGALYFYLFFRTTVSTDFGEMHNLGLLTERSNGLIGSGVAAGIGLVLMAVLRK